MEVISPSNDGVQQAIRILREGGVIAHATETCYGLACDIGNRDAVRRLFRIKRRPEEMPVSALFASVERAKKYLEWNDAAERLSTQHLPGPLTIVLKLRPDAPHTLFPIPNPQSPIPTVGLRLSPHATAMKLVEAFGSPLSTTSANLHGEPNPYSAHDIVHQYDGMTDVPDLILDEGPIAEQEASTVVDVSNGSVRIIRQGNVRLEIGNA